MIPTFILHASIVGALCTIAAWAFEQERALCGRPRRFAWVLGMLARVVIPLPALTVIGYAQATTMCLSLSQLDSVPNRRRGLNARCNPGPA